ncbi:Epidermal growth factor receptor [Amphibalanus amphitrite]|uniref:receptor protein-tyrosine kinase n=1 Tax=Amphibalanus amphitrite TaxID=1232801 RepID=A0A6A4WRC8_AMPAM|nr:Epidermal growth factor receptor [Amphibalanus amphitrite]
MLPSRGGMLLGCALALCAALQAGLVAGQLPPEFNDGSTTHMKQKICIGTSGRMSVPGNRTTHYQNLRDRYTNCTYVDGNLELTWLQDDSLDLSFLQYIREVTGYVLISYVDVRRLVLPSLQIIRGRTLFKLSVRDEEFSLMVTMSKMFSLEMPALRDILAGSAGFFNNYNLCHIKSINWDEILTGPGAHDVYVYNFTERERNCSSCHPSCPAEGGCWGPGPDNCQQLSKINCSPQCHGGRCFGPEPRQCCHLFCAGGCTGPTQSDCLACRNFYDNGVCKQECPSMMRYNSITYSWEPNPDGKFAYGATCVRECPEHLLKDNSACVRACPANKKAKNGECVPCNGPCPKTCPVDKLEIIHAGNIDKFKNCTILQGSLQILQHSFDGYQEIYENYTFGPHHGKMHPSKLEVFSTVKEITGFVNIDAYHPEFRDLGFLRRLEVIGGRYLHEYFSALYVVKTSLESLRLDSLQKVRSGGVMIVENKRLCFAEGIKWQAFISREQKSQSYDVMVDKNRNASECAADGQVCHEQCTEDGCWAAGADSCLHCKHFRVGERCVEKCDKTLGKDIDHLSRSITDRYSERCRAQQQPLTDERCLNVNETCPMGTFLEFVAPQKQGRLRPLAGKNICRGCHPRCKNCTGFGFHINVCHECVHYRSGEQCEDECDVDFYVDEERHECLRCAAECQGCYGPGQRCKTCRNYRIYLDSADGSSNSSAFNCTTHCPESHPHKIFPGDDQPPYCSTEPGVLPLHGAEDSVTIIASSVSDERELMRSLAASALDGPTDVLVNAGEYLNPQGPTGFSTAAPSLRSGYPASSLATLQDEHDEWGRAASPASRAIDPRRRPTDSSKCRSGSASSTPGDCLQGLDCDQVDNDCFEPAGYSSLPVGGAAGGSAASSGQATVGGLKLHLPLDEDDYLMPSNGQQAGYMDLGGHQKGDAASSQASCSGEHPFMLSMDNPEYHMVASRGLLHGSLAGGPPHGYNPNGYGPGYGATATYAPLSEASGPTYASGRTSGQPSSFAGTPPVSGAFGVAGGPSTGAYPSTSLPGGGFPHSAPPSVAYPASSVSSSGTFANSAPPSGAYPPSGALPPGGTYPTNCYGTSSPNSVGVPVAEGAARWAARRAAAEQNYDYYGDERSAEPSGDNEECPSETTV